MTLRQIPERRQTQCPRCASHMVSVLPVVDAESTKQWSECVTCGHLWTIARDTPMEEQRVYQPRASDRHQVLPDSARVLVIDDVDATRSGLAQLLRLRGFDTLEARNGVEGLHLLRNEHNIRVVVLDLLMPGSNGYWFRERQLDDPALASIPVIVFTGATEEQLRDGLRVTEILRKPVSVDQLFEAVSRYCAA